MNWVISNAATRTDCPNGTVAEMAIGGSYSTSMNNAAAAIVSSGTFLSVAAGSENANAANYSPASAPSACTVGAITSSNARASFSNYGAVVDLYAPGSNIQVLFPGGTVSDRVILLSGRVGLVELTFLCVECSFGNIVCFGPRCGHRGLPVAVPPGHAGV